MQKRKYLLYYPQPFGRGCFTVGKQTQKQAAETQGLHIDRKTVFAITLLLAVILVFAGALTQWVPRGEYQLDADGSVINGTYETLTDAKMPLWKVLASPVLIFTRGEATTALGIIVFIILIGGTFLILDKSGILQYTMRVIVHKYEKKKYVLLATVSFVFMLLAAVIGILEESITLVPLAVAISLALGWDSLVGVGMSLVSVAFGFTAALFNPFNVVVVQQMAGLPLFSGLWLRVIVFVLVYAVLLAFLIPYAKKVERRPEKSLVYESDRVLREKYSAAADGLLLQNPHLRKAAMLFALCLLAAVIPGLAGLLLQRYATLPEGFSNILDFLPMAAMALLFTGGGIAAGSVAGLRGKKLAQAFAQGIKTIAPALPLVLMVVCVTYILQEGKIIHTLLYWVYENIKGFPPGASLLVIFAFVMVLEFFVGSGTAKAFLIMPIVLPLAQLVGLTEQSVVLAFSFGDGFCNILYPTSGVMIIAIGLVGISYGKYMRWFWKLFAAEMLLSVAVLLLASAVGYH